ncbi:MAG: aminotransferase class I/II-fold pyridoxal phosphate-dependent enzyme [Candidatus Zixiibacteriota bacterium]
MIEGSKKLEQFMQYAFAKLNEARDKAAKDFEIIDMGIGDPEMATDKTIQKAMIDSLDEDGIFRYPSYMGEDYMREAAAEYMRKRFCVEVDKDSEIIVLMGSKSGIFNLPRAIMNPGETGAYTEPGYPVYRSGIALAGGKPMSLPLRIENDFIPDLDMIPEDTKITFINYPNNPTTATAEPQFFKDAIKDARKKNYLLVNDAAYIDIYEKTPQPSILQYTDENYENILEIHSLSKGFAMTGWRIAFAVGSKTAIKYLGALKKQIDSGVFMPIQKAATYALENYKMSRDVCRIYFERRNKVISALEKTHLFKRIYPSDATFYIWAQLKDEDSSESFAKKLLTKHGIVCLPGSYLGEHGEGFVRFSMTLKDRDIDKAVERLIAIK